MNKTQTKTLIFRSVAAVTFSLLATVPLGLAQTQPADTTNITPATQPSTQPTTRPTTRNGHVTRENGGFLLNFQDVSIDVILNELSDVAGFIVVKEVRTEGRVSLISKQPISADDAVSLLNTVLRNAGYAAIRQDRILKIVNKDAAKRLNIPVRTGNDPTKIASSDELITQVVPLRYADATQLKNDLQPLINTEADFASNASSNALVITDTSANVKRVVEIVAALDTSVADSVDVKTFTLKFANATTAAKLVNDVFGNLDASRTPSGTGQDQNQGGGRGGPGGGGGDPRDQFRRFMQQQAQGSQGSRTQAKITAAADERTNSLVVTGPTDTLGVVAEVIKELDANPAIEETVFVYRLRNSQAANVEGVLNNLFNGTGSTSTGTQQSNADVLRNARTNSGTSGSLGSGRSSSSRGGSTSTGGFGAFGGFGGFNSGQQRFGGQTNQNNRNTGGQRVSQGAQDIASSLAGQVSIIADADSNSLLIRTSPGNYERVKEVLSELDKPAAQVLIKVLIAEVTHGNGFDIGTEFSVLNARATNALGNTTAGQEGGTNFNIPTNGLTGTGLVVQLLESNFTATIRALETAGKLDVLSRPYILASDNQLASITVGQEVPLIDSSRITDTGQTINTLRYEDVGILLDVIAHVNSDGLVILDVAPEISTLTGETVPISDTASQPIIAKRSAQTRVAVRSSQTIVIGGLMEDRLTNSVNKVPILGDIPLIWPLFSRTTSNKSKTELLIFLTPHVAATPEELTGMSKEETDGTKLLPNAIDKGVYERHQDNMRRGSGEFTPTSQPSTQPMEGDTK